MHSVLRPLIVTMAAFALALAGGGIAKLAGIPAPWLLGAVVGSLLLGAIAVLIAVRSNNPSTHRRQKVIFCIVQE